MGITVNANLMSIVHAGSTGVSPSFPDVCKTPSPAGPIPIPYPNIAQSSDTDKGSSTVKIDKKNVMIKGASFKMSTGDEAGSAQGLVSNKIKGKAEFINYSFDVKIDGKNVVRLLDPAATNQGSPANSASLAIGQSPVITKGKEAKPCQNTKALEKKQNSGNTNWGKCGIHPDHKAPIQKVADDLDVILFFRKSNNDCLEWIAKKHQPKPHSPLDAGTIKAGSSLEKCQAWLSGISHRRTTWDYKTLTSDVINQNSDLFFSIDANDFKGAVMSDLGNSNDGMPMQGIGESPWGDDLSIGWRTGDYDLMDVIDNKTNCSRPFQHSSAFSQIQNAINESLKWEAIQHPPQAQWRSKDPNYFEMDEDLRKYLRGKIKTIEKRAISSQRKLPFLSDELTVVAPKNRVMTLHSDEEVKDALLCAGCAKPDEMRQSERF